MSNSSTTLKAIAYIRAGIEKNEWRSGDRLPPTRLLARRIQIHLVTLGKALKILVDTGVLTVIPRKGFYVGIPATELKTHPVSPRSWKRIRARLEHDIYNGYFNTDGRPGATLPQNSILQKHYGVSYQTIRKACAELMREGILMYRGNRYHLSINHSTAPTAAILSLSMAHWQSRSISLYNDFIIRGLSALELVSFRNNFSLIKKGIKPGMEFERLLTDKTFDDYFGYIIWTTGMEAGLISRLCERLRRSSKPVVFIDEESSFSLPERFAAKDRYRIFSPAHTAAGMKTAHHLSLQGHSKCAYLSNIHQTRWSQQRLEGAKRIFPGALCEFVCSSLPDTKVHHDSSNHSFLQNVEKGIIKRFGETLWWFGPALQPHLHDLEKKESVFNTVLCKELFCQAVADPSITAWICANDFIAIAASVFLARKHPHLIDRIVPLKIAIAGFDNQPLAAEHEITSYDLMPIMLVEKVVGYLINPRQEFYKGKSRIEVEGLLIARESTEINRNFLR